MQRFARQMHREKADAGADLEEAGHQPGTDRTKQKLGKGRACSKQHGRGEREQDSWFHGRHNLHHSLIQRVRRDGQG